MSNSNYDFFTKTDFVRPTLEDVHFLYCQSKLDYYRASAKGNRRGNYYFKCTLSFFDRNDDIQKVNIVINYQPHYKNYYLLHAINPLPDKTPNDTIDTYLFEDKIGSNTRISKKEYFDEEVLEAIHYHLLEAIKNREFWIFHASRPHYTISGVGKFCLASISKP